MSPFPCCLSRLTVLFVGPKYLFKLWIRHGYWRAHVLLLQPLQWNKSCSCTVTWFGWCSLVSCVRGTNWGFSYPVLFFILGATTATTVWRRILPMLFTIREARDNSANLTHISWFLPPKKGRFYPQMHIFAELLGVRKYQKVESVEKSKEQRW